MKEYIDNLVERITGQICRFMRECDNRQVLDFEDEYETTVEAYTADCLHGDPSPIIEAIAKYADNDDQEAAAIIANIDCYLEMSAAYA